jgi:predicted lactoylglutathione lyase
MSENTTPEIDRTIYPMPMFATFQVADIAAAEAFYNAVGFHSLATGPGPDGSPAVVHLRRMRYQDILLVPGHPQRGSMTVSFSAGGQDLGELAAAARAAAPQGASIEGPAATAWFTHDVTIEDPDGNRIIMTAPQEGTSAQREEFIKAFEGDFLVEK